MLLMFCAALVLGACEYAERPENAAERRFTWFSYLASEDLKESCRSHAPPRYRFIYNAIFSEQVSTYEINGLPDGGGGMIDAEILSSKVSPDFLLHFPNWPWSGKHAVVRLYDVEMNLLRTSLEASGFFDSPSLGKILDSHSFYCTSAFAKATAFTSMPGYIRHRSSPTFASLTLCNASTAPRSPSRKHATCPPKKPNSGPGRRSRKTAVISASLPKSSPSV